MPLISYLCSCGNSLKKYQKVAKDSLPFVICDKCGLEAKRTLGNTSSSYKVTIDNGVMGRAVHVDPNIMEINDERSSKDYSEEE